MQIFLDSDSNCLTAMPCVSCLPQTIAHFLFNFSDEVDTFSDKMYKLSHLLTKI
jgi:hypothetical protein